MTVWSRFFFCIMFVALYDIVIRNSQGLSLFERVVVNMQTLDRPTGATQEWLDGPFYPESMEWLAQVVAAAQPADTVDLDPVRWCQRANFSFEGTYGLAEFDDGSRSWWGIRMRVMKAVELWLVLPCLVEAEDAEGKVFERSPALYAPKEQEPWSGKLTAEDLELVAVRLASAFTRD